MSKKQARKNKGVTPRMKESKKPTDLIGKLKGLSPLSWFFVIVTVGILVTLIFITANVTNKVIEDSNYKPYYDKDLNISISVPSEWSIVEPDEKEIKEVVAKSTDSLGFDMSINALRGEIVPIALTVPVKKGEPLNKFMTLSYRGSDSKYSYLQDKVKLMDDFKQLLKQLKHTKIVADEIKDVDSEKLHGIILTGTGVLDGVKMYYTQYFEKAGANTLTVTFGTSHKKLEGIKEIERVTEKLIYVQGGATIPLTEEGKEERIKMTREENKESSEVKVKTDESQTKGDIKISENK